MKIFSLWLPLAFLVFQLVLEFSLPSQALASLHSEGGPHENLQFLTIAAAFIVALTTLAHVNWKTQKWLGAWVALAAVCCFYVAGEEISWGQHLLHWTTPEFWTQVNDQNETNLHNTSAWLDQKPRLLLEIGILFGGIIFPIAQRFRPGALPKKFKVIYPPSNLFPAAFLALLVNMIDRIKFLHIFERASEVEELYMFYFVLLYLIALRGRILQDKR